MPGLRKDGYTESVDVSSPSSSRPTLAPRPERPPDVPETHPLYQPITPRNPLEIGVRDRNPFPNAFGPPPLFSDDNDGMFVGPNHPIFNSRLGQIHPVRGPWGGDGYLPPLGAPSGARFDPIGPGPGMGRGRGIARRFSHEPDNDEFMPPGMVSYDVHSFNTSDFGDRVTRSRKSGCKVTSACSELCYCISPAHFIRVYTTIKS